MKPKKIHVLSGLVYSFISTKMMVFISEIVQVDNIWINSLDISIFLSPSLSPLRSQMETPVWAYGDVSAEAKNIVVML